MNIKLEKIYSQIPKSICPPNCGECCGVILPSLAEIRNIKDWCEERHVEYKDFYLTVGLDCPYLSDSKECTIYPVRPFLCRLLGVSKSLPCPLGKCRAAKVLNRAQSNQLYKAIYLHGKEKSRIERHRRLLKGIFDEVLM